MERRDLLSGAPSLTTIASFGGVGGSSPTSALLKDASGNFFGTTKQGGASNDGTVFEVKAPGVPGASGITMLASFTSTTGASPSSTLVEDAWQQYRFGTTLSSTLDHFESTSSRSKSLEQQGAEGACEFCKGRRAARDCKKPHSRHSQHLTAVIASEKVTSCLPHPWIARSRAYHLGNWLYRQATTVYSPNRHSAAAPSSPSTLGSSPGRCTNASPGRWFLHSSDPRMFPSPPVRSWLRRS